MISQTGAGDENGSDSRRSSSRDERRPSLRRVDQESLLKVRRDSKSRRPSLAELVPDWPALQKVKRPEKVKFRCLALLIQHRQRLGLNICYSYTSLSNPCMCFFFSKRMFCICMSMSKQKRTSNVKNICLIRKKNHLLNHYKI